MPIDDQLHRSSSSDPPTNTTMVNGQQEQQSANQDQNQIAPRSMSPQNQPPPQPQRLTFRDLCCLFCCPPLPSSIVSKLAFMPPPASYKFCSTDSSGSRFAIQLNERTEWPYDKTLLTTNVDVFYTRTSRHNRLACMYVRWGSSTSNRPRYTLLFSHGNAVDLGQMCSFFYGLGCRLECDVFGYDYSGYGASSGRPSEKNLYADIEAAWNALRAKYDLTNDRVVLYGQSIGTAPSVDLASRVKPAALVLHSPLMSGMRVAFPDTTRTWCCDAFPIIDKIIDVHSPTLFIHGTEDEVIDFSHGVSLYERCPHPVTPLWVPGAGHNDIEMNPVYLERLKRFVSDEVHRCQQITSSPEHHNDNGAPAIVFNANHTT